MESQVNSTVTDNDVLVVIREQNTVCGGKDDASVKLLLKNRVDGGSGMMYLITVDLLTLIIITLLIIVVVV